MATRVAIVTGSNKGVGLAIVRGLCKNFKGDVYLTSRDQERGMEAVKQLEAENLSPKYHKLDIASKESISEFKKFIHARYGGVDVLINNAGVAFTSSSSAPDIEQASVTLEINFVGTLNMMKEFYPITKPHGRIVNVSSMVCKLARLGSQELRDKFKSPTLTTEELVSMMEVYIQDVKEGKHVERGWSSNKYGNSKVAVTALTKIYSREEQKRDREDVLINCCCPGLVKTDMAGDQGILTPDEGAETPLMLAFLPPGSPSGEFWERKAVSVW